MIGKSTLAVAGLAALAVTGAASSASAHGHHRHFFFGYNPGLRIYTGPPIHDCGYYREMWEETGRFYWKRRYYECKGWW